MKITPLRTHYAVNDFELVLFVASVFGALSFSDWSSINLTWDNIPINWDSL